MTNIARVTSMEVLGVTLTNSLSVAECVCVCVSVCLYVPHNDQLGRTDFPHNALSPQCIVGTYRCVCVRHTFCQLAYRSDPSTDFYS